LDDAVTVRDRVEGAWPRRNDATFADHGARIPGRVVTNADSHVITVRCERPGVVLAVRGCLDHQARELLAEVVRAALVAVGRASRIHLDLSEVSPPMGQPPRIVEQLERAGAKVTVPAGARSAPSERPARPVGALR
jgi:hypothetical protein